MIVVIPTIGFNHGSILAALQRLEADVLVSEAVAVIRRADRVILPGVGHAKAAMQRLAANGLSEIIPGLTQPVLGICLGMQILFEHLEEGDVPGLGIIPGTVRHLPESALPLPHMGWNQVENKGEIAFNTPDFAESEYFYFIHSYAADSGPWVTGTCDYGESIVSTVAWRNFRGAQFHPERSGKAGLRFLERFLLS